MQLINKDLMDSLRSTISRYLFPGLLGLAGLTILISSSGQNFFFKLGGAAIIIIAVISSLFIAGIISRAVQTILLVVLILGAGYLSYLDYYVIEERLQYDEKKGQISKKVIQRLKDIRTAQLAYQKVHGRYTNNFDTLITFLKEGQMPIIKSIGSLPDSIPTIEEAMELGLVYNSLPEGVTEDQAVEQGLIIRDTMYVSVLENTFLNNESQKKRTLPFNVDSLRYVPVSGVEFRMQADMIDVGGVTKPVFEVVDPQPFDEQLKVGSLTEVTTNGNWTE